MDGFVTCEEFVDGTARAPQVNREVILHPQNNLRGSVEPMHVEVITLFFHFLPANLCHVDAENPDTQVQDDADSSPDLLYQLTIQ